MLRRGDVGLIHKVDKRAERFSQEYFEKLYRKWEKGLLDSSEAHSKRSGQELYESLLLPPKDSPYMAEYSDEEYEQWAQEVRERACECALAHVWECDHAPFDRAAEARKLRRWFRQDVRYWQETLPPEILQQIADIRVFALCRMSKAVKKPVTALRKAADARAAELQQAYADYYEEAFSENPPDFERVSLHDCVVLSCRKRGADLRLTPDNSGGFCSVTAVTFKTCTILEQERGCCKMHHPLGKNRLRAQWGSHFASSQMQNHIFSHAQCVNIRSATGSRTGFIRKHTAHRTALKSTF